MCQLCPPTLQEPATEASCLQVMATTKLRLSMLMPVCS